MWSNAASAIKTELGPAEQLLWSGQPRQGVRLHASDVFVIPFSILWCGFAIFWVVMAVSATSSSEGWGRFLLPLFGVPFVLVGLYFVFGRFIADARRRARTYYGVTNERIIVVSGGPRRRATTSLELRNLQEIALKEWPDGSGTITFGPSHAFAWMAAGGACPGAGPFQPLIFDRIERPRDVQELIRRTQKRQGQSG